MSFNDDLAATAEDLFALAGEPADWNGQDITVLPGVDPRTRTGSAQGPDLGVYAETKLLQILPADVELIGRPVPGERVSLNDEEWDVARVWGDKVVSVELGRYLS